MVDLNIINFLKERKDKICSIIAPNLVCDQHGKYGYIAGKVSKIPQNYQKYNISFIVTKAKKVSKDFSKRYEIITEQEFMAYLIDKMNKNNNVQVITFDNLFARLNKNKTPREQFEQFYDLIIKNEESKNIHSDNEYITDVAILEKYIHEHGYPTNTKVTVYNIIRRLVQAYSRKELSKELIGRIERLKDWTWDYQRLQLNGQRFSTVIEKLEKKMQLTGEDRAILDLMRNKMYRGKLSEYFAAKLRNIGPN